MYRQGLGVPKDEPLGTGFYEKACALGDADSCGNAGAIYFDGMGVPKDAAKGVLLSKRACELGDKQSCAFLAKLGK
jgi:hypothetical protein